MDLAELELFVLSAQTQSLLVSSFYGLVLHSFFFVGGVTLVRWHVDDLA